MDVSDTDEILITVLLPNYNGERYLKDAIDSVLAQTFTSFELLIIDDCSSDSSVEIIEQYTDSRINLVKPSSRLGLVESLNMGIKIAKGIYIARMDSDDVMFKNRLLEQSRYMEDHTELDMVSSNAAIINELGTNTGQINPNKGISPQMVGWNILWSNNPIIHPCTMIRKSTLIETGGYPTEKTTKAEDFALWIKLLKSNKQLEVLSQTHLLYRIHSSQLTTEKENVEEYAFYWLLEYLKDFYKDKPYENIIRIARVEQRNQDPDSKDIIKAVEMLKRVAITYAEKSENQEEVRKQLDIWIRERILDLMDVYNNRSIVEKLRTLRMLSPQLGQDIISKKGFKVLLKGVIPSAIPSLYTSVRLKYLQIKQQRNR